MIKFSIIIPHHKNPENLKELLNSLKTQNNFEIIIVNNASNTNFSFLRNYPLKIKLLNLSKNKGFAGGVNAGLNVCTGEWIVITNDDVVFSKNFFKILNKLVETKKEIKVIAPLVLNYYNKNVIDSCGIHYPLNCRPYNIGHGEKLSAEFLKERWVMGFTGACAVIKREILMKEKFDESFFCYFEDVDLSLRLYKKGIKTYFSPDLKVYHKEGSTISSNPGLKVFLISRNKIWTIYKNFSFFEILKRSPFIFWGLVQSAGYHFLISDKFLEFLTGTLSGFLYPLKVL